jgi:hypothetical protein
MAGVAHLRNLWDLSADHTLEFSLFGAQGRNQYESTTRAFGSDLILKWRPSVSGKYKAVIWQTEYLSGNIQNTPTGPSVLSGIASWLQYQFAERWWAQARFDYEGLPHAVGRNDKCRQSALLGFLPSEFSGFRLQYDHLKIQNLRDDHRVAFQWNISIGAHPAHAY